MFRLDVDSEVHLGAVLRATLLEDVYYGRLLCRVRPVLAGTVPFSEDATCKRCARVAATKQMQRKVWMGQVGGLDEGVVELARRGPSRRAAA